MRLIELTNEIERLKNVEIISLEAEVISHLAEIERLLGELRLEKAAGIITEEAARIDTAEILQLKGELGRLSDHYQDLMKECDEKDAEIERLRGKV